MGIEIRGLLETQNYLEVLGIKMNVLRVEIIEQFARKVAEVARTSYPATNVDTGALLQSIGNKILSQTANEIVEEIFIGSELVARGEGRFRTSRKSGRVVSYKPTEEYAPIAHREKSNELIADIVINQAYQWAEKNVDREIKRIISQL